MIGKYHGLKLFDGFLTAMNETGHIRIQALTHGEGHDQCHPLIKSFVQMQLSNGHPLASIAMEFAWKLSEGTHAGTRPHSLGKTSMTRFPYSDKIFIRG
jgi:hypothetical protein